MFLFFFKKSQFSIFLYFLSFDVKKTTSQKKGDKRLMIISIVCKTIKETHLNTIQDEIKNKKVKKKKKFLLLMYT